MVSEPLVIHHENRNILILNRIQGARDAETLIKDNCVVVLLVVRLLEISIETDLSNYLIKVRVLQSYVL